MVVKVSMTRTSLSVHLLRGPWPGQSDMKRRASAKALGWPSRIKFPLMFLASAKKPSPRELSIGSDLIRFVKRMTKKAMVNFFHFCSSLIV